jgi:hypothetical protein
LKKIFQIRFGEDSLQATDKKDGLLCLAVYVYYMIVIYLFGLLLFNTSIYDNLSAYFKSKTLFRFLFYIPDTIINMLPVFIILLLRRQSLSTIGISKKNVGKSVLIGIAGSIPFSLANIIGSISSGKTLHPNPVYWLWTFLYYFP